MRGGQLLAGVAVAAVLVTGAAVAAGTTQHDTRPAPGPGFGSGPVTPADPVDPTWARAVAGLVAGVDPGSPNPCQAGREECLEAVVAEMAARLEVRSCAHTAPFAFTYQEMTKGVGRGVADDAFFAAPAVTAHLDALFARFYFDAFDSWTAGRRDEVPGAWQMAFEAADRGESTAAADMLLGMNAHISRDLAYAVDLALSGAPEGGVDPTDFRLVNEIIRDVAPDMLARAADRFDPRLNDLDDLQGDLGPEVDTTELIALWRDQAFALGVRLHDAPDPEARRVVEGEIERAAVAGATVILNADAVGDLGLPPDERDAFCAAAR